MSISTKQALLLNNLIYLDSASGPYPDPLPFTGQTIKDWLDAFDLTLLYDPEGVPLPMTTKVEIRNVLLAAMKDPFLMKMKILTVFSDDSEAVASTSAIFVSDDTPDVVVVFRGTDVRNSLAQWRDNFFSANSSDTPHQTHALEWYRDCIWGYHLSSMEITVTGHSKGGNKAKYITILDDSVDHCISFDGEGFSDKFFEKYRNEILLRGDRIQNHMVNYDYVSPLMNDVGSSMYYHGHNYGSGRFVENHMVNTFMKFDGEGDFRMEIDEAGKPPEIMAFDEFINSYLRSMEDGPRSSALATFSRIASTLMNATKHLSAQQTALILLNETKKEDNCRNIAYLAAYLIRYEQRYPVMVEFVNSVFSRFDMEDLAKYVTLFAQIINWKKRFLWIDMDFARAVSTVNRIRNRAPDFFQQNLKRFLEKKGIYLLRDEIRTLEKLVDHAEEYLRTITITEDTLDRKLFPEAKV